MSEKQHLERARVIAREWVDATLVGTRDERVEELAGRIIDQVDAEIDAFARFVFMGDEATARAHVSAYSEMLRARAGQDPPR